ncbi:MAG: formate dehydrogenase accessory sulfurtransferase FdhD [Gemmatimonadales bacterium]
MPTTDGGGLPPALRPDHPLLGLGYARPVRRRALTRLEGGARQPGDADVAEEVPVSLIYNRVPHAVMMATPADLEDFGVGFTVTEGIVESAAELGRVEVQAHAQGIEVQLEIPDAAAGRLASRRRALIGRTSCGLCGVEVIQDAVRELRPVSPEPTFPVEALWRVEAELPSRQEMNRETGSLHAAAWATAEGELEVVREDVGRHNALDKVIGALMRAGKVPASGFLVMTSRASYELVQKAVAVGVPLLAAVSRPTGLAIRLAEASGLTLVALLRGHTANVYANGERLRGR